MPQFNVYFVTETYLKTYTNIGKSVDANLITPLVKTAADMWVRSILGTYFYEDLLTKFNAQTLSANETILVEDYIKGAVAWRAASDIVINSAMQIKNKGPQKQTGDYSTNTEFKETAFVEHQNSQKAQFYENRLFEWLKENGNLFAAFESDLNIDSTAKRACHNRDRSNFQSGIYII